ncbi:MAG: type II secretion system protein [Halolamina sp.]
MTVDFEGRCHAFATALEEALQTEYTPVFSTTPCLASVGTALTGLVALLTASAAIAIPGSAGPRVGGIGLALAGTLAYGTWVAPDVVASFRRRTAAGGTPELVAYAVLQARLTPSLERAARFAGQHAGGDLGRSLARLTTGATTGRSGWERFAEEWSEFDESLPRSVSLLVAGIESAPPARDALLDRALQTVLAGSRDRVASFASAVRAPATGIYAFGVMLPLALVGLLPVAASAGVGVSPAGIAVLYDGVIPIGLLGASAWLAARRPAVSRPPTGVDALRSPRSLTLTGALVGGTAVATAVLARAVFPGWTTWILVPGVSLGVGIVYWFDPVRERRESVQNIETGVPDAVTLVGHRLAAGDPLETAVAVVGERLTGETAAVFRTATTRHRRLRITMAEAFTGSVGALEPYASPRTETAIALIEAAARNGTDGGETLVTVSSYLRELDAVEREARRELARTTGTLRQTALVFGPAIAGVTVALATGMGALGDTGQAVSVPALGVVVGGYVLALAVVLPALSVVLERGLDGALVGYRIGVALATASTVYPVTFLAARTVVQV